ncbi:hypothetical protein [Apilactobacillus timberlakei]|uniref:hypothetical protein n=1 Tax=Apilactobacillus timberlakei TaxID=2008380 RepID=UPI001125BDC6|nr:hypothetical protein [Apilactobacillus timberlakei]TPR16676.1 hypothetical protein DYZ95_07485 [Apilactobacillus timberlakei]
MQQQYQRGRIYRPYQELLENNFAQQIIIKNLKNECDVLQTCMDAQSRELNLLRMKFNADEALINKYYQKGAFND